MNDDIKIIGQTGVGPTPIFHTRATEIFANAFHYQHNRFCREFELNMLECLDAYGRTQGLDKCKDEMDDMMECAFHFKQKARAEAIRKERERQYANGERTKENLYLPRPILGSFEESHHHKKVH